MQRRLGERRFFLDARRPSRRRTAAHARGRRSAAARRRACSATASGRANTAASPNVLGKTLSARTGIRSRSSAWRILASPASTVGLAPQALRAALFAGDRRRCRRALDERSDVVSQRHGHGQSRACRPRRSTRASTARAGHHRSDAAAELAASMRSTAIERPPSASHRCRDRLLGRAHAVQDGALRPDGDRRARARRRVRERRESPARPRDGAAPRSRRPSRARRRPRAHRSATDHRERASVDSSARPSGVAHRDRGAVACSFHCCRAATRRSRSTSRRMRGCLASRSRSQCSTGLIFGVAPAWQASHVDPHTALKSQGRGVAEAFTRLRVGKSARRIADRHLTGAHRRGGTCSIGSWRRLATLNPGFRRHDVLLVSADLHGAQLQPEQRDLMTTQMLARLRRLPGVRKARRQRRSRP